MPKSMKMSEFSALSHALDMTEGHPSGHCVRACWVGKQIGQALKLDNLGAMGAVLHTSSQGRRL